MVPRKKMRINPRGKTKTEIEKSICKNKLDALTQEESLTKENRFTADERRRLLEAFNERGFPAFQDTKLLHQYLPNRCEADLKGLLDRLKGSLLMQLASDTNEQANEHNDDEDKLSNLNAWQSLCHRALGNFAKDRKVNLDDIFPDALLREAGESLAESIDEGQPSVSAPDYPKLLDSLAQLISGKFPERPCAINALVSMRLFYDLEEIVNSLPLEPFESLSDGSWLTKVAERRRKIQLLALEGLELIDGKVKKCPTINDVENERKIEALCLELPKIRRITDVLNPLHIEESLNESLIVHLTDLSM